MKIENMLLAAALIGVFTGCTDNSKQKSFEPDRSDWLGSITIVDKECTLIIVAQGPQIKNAVQQIEMQKFVIKRPCQQFVDAKFLKVNEQQRLEFPEEIQRVHFSVLEGMMEKILGPVVAEATGQTSPVISK